MQRASRGRPALADGSQTLRCPSTGLTAIPGLSAAQTRVPGEPWSQLGCSRPSVGWASTPHGGRLHEPGPEPLTSGWITLCCSAQGSTPAPCSPGVSSTPSSSAMTATCAPGKHTPLDLYNNPDAGGLQMLPKVPQVRPPS